MFAKTVLEAGQGNTVEKGSEVALNISGRLGLDASNAESSELFFSSDSHHGGPLLIKAGMSGIDLNKDPTDPPKKV